jgi:hypothetical protein
MAPTIENHSKCKLQSALNDGQRRRVPPRSTSFFEGRMLGLIPVPGRERPEAEQLFESSSNRRIILVQQNLQASDNMREAGYQHRPDKMGKAP